MKITTAQIITQIKTWLLPVIIFLLSLFLAQEMMIYFKNFDIFNMNLLSLPKITGIMLALCFMIALSVPAWGGGKFLLIVPLPLSLGIYLNLLILEPLNALIVCGVAFLISSIYIEKSIKIQGNLIKNIPNISLRPAIKGYLFTISISAAFIVLLNPQGDDLTIGRAVSKAIMNPVQILMGNEMNSLSIIEKQAIEQEMEEQIMEGVKKAIEPYRHLINVITAVAVFLGMQGLNALIYLIYSIFINPVFWIAKRLKFIVADLESVQKEFLHF